MRARRRWAGALVALSLLTPSIAARLPASAATREEKDLAEVQRVLDAQVAAVRSGNRTAFLATIDPEAPRAFHDAQARRFDGLRAVPLERFTLEARTRDAGDLGRGVAPRYGGARIFLPETRQTLRITGYDDRDALANLWLTFVQRDGRWYVGADEDLASVGLDTNRDFWELGPVHAERTPHFLVLSRPAHAERARALAAVAEKAAAALDKRWTAPWSRRVPLIVPGSIKELEVMLQATVDLDKFVAFAAYGYDPDASYASTAARIYVNDRNLSRYSEPQQVETLVHELNHVAASVIAGPVTPLWVHEGIAEWVTKPRASARKPGGDATLPRDFEFVSGSQGAIVRAYAEGRTAIASLAAARGPDAPVRLMTELGLDRVAPGNADHLLDAALRRTAGMGTADLERAWAARR